MISGGVVEVVALMAAFAIAVVTTPAGVSGAVLLLPFQVSVLGTPSPSVTPTNLLYNVVACPGAIWRYWRQGQTGGTLTWLLLAGTLPGVIAGSIIRVYLLPGPVVFDFVVAAVLIPLGAWLALARVNPARSVRGARLPGSSSALSLLSRAALAASMASAADQSLLPFWLPTVSRRLWLRPRRSVRRLSRRSAAW
jgi:uncharacterized protein